MPPFTRVSHHLCPYVQRAAIALAEKDVPFERISIDLAHKPDWFKPISPTGKVPVLIIDGRHVLFESAAICDYLDETLEPRLHPEDPIERAQHRAWIEFASGTLNDIGGLYTARDERAFEDKLAGLFARFRRIEEALGEGPYFTDLTARPSVRDAVKPDYPARLRSFLMWRGSYMSGLIPAAA